MHDTTVLPGCSEPSQGRTPDDAVALGMLPWTPDARSLDRMQGEQAHDFIPLAPKSLKHAGLAPGEVESLVLKFLLNIGSATGMRIAEQVFLPPRLIRPVLDEMKANLLLLYKASADMGDFLYQLTETGVSQAQMLSARCTYFGSAPVPLDDYVRTVKLQSIGSSRVGIKQLCHAFYDLMLTPELVSQLGQAINAGRGLFLYGAPGNGKTSIAERITRAFGQHVWIPRTVSITGEMIRVFDPSNHEQLKLEDLGMQIDPMSIDRRWVLVRRPTIVVGGELTLDHLDIRFNPATGINEAPVHMKSNCGTLVVDDFGRQRVSSRDLLNRWIIPLEKRHDYLNLPSGRQVQVPFEQLLVLSTNLDPSHLVNEAFLRRIPYKIEVSDPSENEFRNLFFQLARHLDLALSEEVLNYLIETYYHSHKRPFRFCHPRDLLLQVCNLCEFLDLPREVTAANIDIAVKNYFAGL